jgi:hypothetical protein
METILDVLQLVVTIAVGVAVFIKRRIDGTERLELGKQYAALACAYADSIGGSDAEKLKHALGAFRLADEKDGKRDYTDAQARAFIEAHLAK